MADPGPSETETSEPEAAVDDTTGNDTTGNDTTGNDTTIDEAAFHDALEAEGRPLATAQQVANRLGVSQATARDRLDALADADRADRLDVETDPVVYYPREWGNLATRERVVVFPTRREIVVDHPTQYTRAQLAQFAHLVDTSGDGSAAARSRSAAAGSRSAAAGSKAEAARSEADAAQSDPTSQNRVKSRRRPGTRGYLYRVRQEDVWAAPFETVEDLLASVREVLPRRYPHLEDWITDQWKRANRFRLYTHEDDYVVLEAASESLLSNVAGDHLEEGQIQAPISETEAWIDDRAVASIKRALYEAGYPVQDDRDLESGDPIDADLTTDLREYQREWVDTFLDERSGVYVGPPGSGKTVAAIATLTEVGGESLVLVPSRELADQWEAELLAHSTLKPDDIGQYHGGEKEIAPVTVATYQTAGMDRHRSLFDSREWGLIVYDEAHHIPSPVFSRSAELQAKHRLGLSATPVRETGSEEEIYTLIGPPIGADWDSLFEAGFVQEPEVEIRYVPWRDEMARNEYVSTRGRERRRIAAENPAKIKETERLLAQHPDKKALVFVEYLDQGENLAAALDVPFISGETRHGERNRLFERFREGDLDTLVVSRVGDEGIDLPDAELAVVASGLGGSRRQGAQRAGRTMRPTGSALVYVLATRGSSEEEFAQRQMRHLAQKGVRVRETNLDE
ncbi:DEAD/DEAH box helicase [Haloparvum sedimenti]|uniref:DEAD/DEAH box helicase n=1 Tax=Haloparvum sedimenti TaxID=1678448 RepID=UPI00071E6D33|nr:DEAD/DEAH box helicase [Haloparvum sedimenti]